MNSDYANKFIRRMHYHVNYRSTLSWVFGQQPYKEVWLQKDSWSWSFCCWDWPLTTLTYWNLRTSFCRLSGWWFETCGRSLQSSSVFTPSPAICTQGTRAPASTAGSSVGSSGSPSLCASSSPCSCLKTYLLMFVELLNPYLRLFLLFLDL